MFRKNIQPGYEHRKVDLSEHDNILASRPVLLLIYGKYHALFSCFDKRSVTEPAKNLGHRNEQLALIGKVERVVVRETNQETLYGSQLRLFVSSVNLCE